MKRIFSGLGLILLVFAGCKDSTNSSTNTKYRQVSIAVGSTTSGMKEGRGTEARLFGPTSITPYYTVGYFTGVADTRSIGMYVVDNGNNAVRLLVNSAFHFLLYKLSSDPLTPLGESWGVVQRQNYLYFSDSSNNRIRRLLSGNSDPDEIYAGSIEAGYKDGQLEVARFSFPMGLSLSLDQKILVADSGNNAIRQIDVSTDQVTTLVSESSRYKKDEEVPLNRPFYVIADAKNNLFIADFNNHVIRYYDRDLDEVSVYAGGLGKSGWVDDQGTAARFWGPAGLALDNAGNLYVADYFNNRIRMIDTNRNVTTYAGSGVFGYQDGPSNQAQFAYPAGLAFDASGNLYVADQGNNMIRFISNDLQ